jgi:hypothetical protein
MFTTEILSSSLSILLSGELVLSTMKKETLIFAIKISNCMQIPQAAVIPLILRQPRRLGVGLADGRVVHVGGVVKVVFLEFTRRYFGLLPALERVIALGQ